MLLQIFGLLLAIAVPAASFVTGLRSTSPFWLWRRRSLLGRSLLSILLVVPVLTTLLVEWLAPDEVYVRAGIVIAIASVGIGPPDLMKHTRSRDESANFVVSLTFVLFVLAPVYLPAVLAIHGAVFGHDVALSSWSITRVVLLQALLPFFAGLVVSRRGQKLASIAERRTERFVNVAFLVVTLFALAVSARHLVAAGARAWLSCFAIAAIAIALGHVLGGPARGTRRVLAMTSAIRFPGLAFLLVSSLPGRSAPLVSVVLAYVISSAVLVGLYGAAMARRRDPVTGPHAAFGDKQHAHSELP